jgi:hypothetical protein
MKSSILQWCAVAVVLAAPASASAQNWEVEAHGGVGFASNPTGGSGSVPGTGSASAATVSSWYFGDGALAVNQALALFRLSGQISSLDTTLQSPFFQRNTGAAIGVRLARVLTPRFSVELSLDNAFGSLQATSASQAALGAASTSFISAWNALLEHRSL